MTGSGPQTVGDFQGSALAASTFRSMADLWHHRVGSTPNAVAMYVRDQKGSLRTIRWSEAARRVREIANGLLASGVQPGDRCALLARSHERWIFADLAIQCVGAVSTPILRSVSRTSSTSWTIAKPACSFARTSRPGRD